MDHLMMVKYVPRIMGSQLYGLHEEGNAAICEHVPAADGAPYEYVVYLDDTGLYVFRTDMYWRKKYIPGCCNPWNVLMRKAYRVLDYAERVGLTDFVVERMGFNEP